METYLFLTVKAPKDEIEQYKARIHPVPGLKLEIQEYATHPADIEARRITPHDYSNLDVRVFSHSYSQETVEKPWRILKTGIREQAVKGTPTVITDLEPFFPAQVELGCGPSIEAGIPPLNYFHKLFSIHKEGKFVLRAEDDEFLNFFDDPLEWYIRAVYMHKQTLLASPTPFYHDLKRLHEEGKIVGPIITNNFDGLALGVGLTELPLRQYDEEGVYPPIAFHPAAKSLFVIGAHADRRKCQQHARRAGLKIVHIDPEGYWNDGRFIPYPLEAPQSEDYVLNASAAEAFKPASQPRR